MTGRPVWLDGRMVQWDKAQASILAHGMQRGALVFDVGAVRPGPGERVLLFRPREHVARFLQSAALVGLRLPYDAESLLAATLEATRGSGARSALVRWSAFVATPESDVVPRRGAVARVAIAVVTPDDYASAGPPPPARPGTARVAIPHDARKAGPMVFPPQAKVSAAYLGPMLAKRRALEAGFDDVVLLDDEGRVAEAPTANVFAVLGGVLVTPPAERALAGITRDAVLALAKVEGIPAREAHLTRQDLAGADEAFLTSTSLPIQPIASVDRRALAHAPGPLTAHVRRVFAACERGEDPRFSHWVVDAA